MALAITLCCLIEGCRRSPDVVPADSTPARWFTDVTSVLGVQFHHVAGTNFLVPEQMGSGVALLDFDNDGRLDIYLVQNGGPQSHAKNQLFHQRSDGTFENASAGSGTDIAGFGMGVAVADVNNDAWPDLLVTEYGGVRLLVNQRDRTFLDATAAAGIDNPRWATSAAFFDYDRDGLLDLVIANYLDYDATQRCFDRDGRIEFCGPHGFPGLVTRLFRNVSSGAAVHFEDVTIGSGLAAKPGPALGVVCADFNGDYWPDIFLADDGRPNRLFINCHDGTFREEAAQRGLAYNAMGQTAGNMGIAIGDVDGNGLFDLFVTHLAEEEHALWAQDRRGLFSDRTVQAHLTQRRPRGTGFGTVLADFDNDGDPDLALVNGRVKRSSSPSAATNVDSFWQGYAQHNQILANDGAGTFRDVSDGNPALAGRAMVGRGLACGDLDNDGGVDLVITAIGGPALVLHNTGPAAHWLTVRAIDPKAGGRDAYGAEVTVVAGRSTHWRLLNPASSYLSSNDPRLHFGLGTNVHFDAVRVVWADGQEEMFAGGSANQLITLRKGSGNAVQHPSQHHGPSALTRAAAPPRLPPSSPEPSGSVARHPILTEGERLLKGGRAEEAVAMLTRGMPTLAGLPEAWALLGRAQLERKECRQAEASFRKALSLSTDSVNAHAQLGIALLCQERYAEAVPEFEAALRLKPDFGEAHFNRGFALARGGRGYEAIESFRSAVRFSPELVDAYITLADLLIQAGHSTEAIQHLQHARALNPDDERVAFLLQRAKQQR